MEKHRMENEGRRLDNGTTEITLRLSDEQLERARAIFDNLDKDGDTPGFLGWGKTEYCVTCGNPPSRRETIEAYGDIHAAIVAASVCGLSSFSLRIGRC
jgi:hypothetical protein